MALGLSSRAAPPLDDLAPHSSAAAYLRGALLVFGASMLFYRLLTIPPTLNAWDASRLLLPLATALFGLSLFLTRRKGLVDRTATALGAIAAILGIVGPTR